MNVFSAEASKAKVLGGIQSLRQARPEDAPGKNPGLVQLAWESEDWTWHCCLLDHVVGKPKN